MPDLVMPAVDILNKRIVLEHTRGRLKGIHSICGLQSELEGRPLPECEQAENMIDAPSMRDPGPVSLVAVKRSYVLYRQIFTPDVRGPIASTGGSFNPGQR